MFVYLASFACCDSVERILITIWQHVLWFISDFLARCFEIRFHHYSTYGAHDSSVKDIWTANIWRKLIASISDPSWTSCGWYLLWLSKVCLSGHFIFCSCATERKRVFFDDNVSSTQWKVARVTLGYRLVLLLHFFCVLQPPSCNNSIMHAMTFTVC